MTETGDERLKDRAPPRGEGALGELIDFLLDNPWLNQALQVAFEARERASQASVSAMRNLNVPTSADIDRLSRRVRAVSERLEGVEDKLDELGRELAALRRSLEVERGPGTRVP
jgi:hypothetical protein